MKKVDSRAGYIIFEVTKGDDWYIHDVFPGSWIDAASRLAGNGDDIDVSYMWDEDVESALKAIESGKHSDYFKRYPYEITSDREIDDWDKACLLHPLFLIATARKGKPQYTLFSVPPADTGSTYYTSNGEYWKGDDNWEPLSDIIGNERLAADFLETIYDYIIEEEISLEESYRRSRRSLLESGRSYRYKY